MTMSPPRAQVAPPSLSICSSPPTHDFGAKISVGPAAGSAVQVSASLFFLASGSFVTVSAVGVPPMRRAYGRTV